jgi:MFS family permease
MTGLVAGIGGQMLLPAGDPHGFRLFCFVAILISLALVPTALSRATAPAHAVSDTKINLMQLYRQSPFGVVAAVLCGITTSSFFALGPIWAQERGLGTTEIALFMTCGTLGGFVTTWPLGWLSDRMDRRHVIIGAAAMAASILLVLIHFVPLDVPVWLLFAYVAIFGGSVIPTYSIVTAHVNDMVKPGEFVAAAGGLLILLGAGAAIGPVIAGAAMTEFGRLGLIYVVVIAQSLMAIWGAYRSIQRAAPPTESKEAFVPEPTVPVGTRLEAH